jgi:hypothetical protein
MQSLGQSSMSFALENGKYPSFDYIRLQKSRFNLAGENEAVNLVLLLEDIGLTGQARGTVHSDGIIDLYIANSGQHCVAHVPHPDEPTRIFILTVFDRSDLSGLGEAWRLARKVFGLTP